jgi:glycosyltransferase involved in cell wall biosynthesis
VTISETKPFTTPQEIAQRQVIFDLTHLVSRLPELASTGIDRIDSAYAAHFAGPGGMAAGLHYGLWRPHLFSVEQAREFVALSRSLWSPEADDPLGSAFATVQNWLAAPPDPDLKRPDVHLFWPRASRAKRRLHRYRGRILNNTSLRVPDHAIYLNVAQHLFEHPIFFEWLKRRDDLRKVFMIHDLLSVDYPEFFSPANLGIFRRRLATAFLHADAFVVSTRGVKRRLEQELCRQGSRPRPIHVQPFPSPLEGKRRASDAERLHRGHPYFVMLGTVEPRKNHLLLLHAWRNLVVQDPRAPRLVLVGGRGWEYEQVADILDRSSALRNHILEIRGLPSSDLIELMRGAQALLTPSFDEGYGLPLVEALSIGTPVVASDIPVFREVTQGRATFISQLNGEAWSLAVKRLADDKDYVAAKRAEARLFEPPTWPGYFEEVTSFLASL